MPKDRDEVQDTLSQATRLVAYLLKWTVLFCVAYLALGGVTYLLLLLLEVLLDAAGWLYGSDFGLKAGDAPTPRQAIFGWPIALPVLLLLLVGACLMVVVGVLLRGCEATCGIRILD